LVVKQTESLREEEEEEEEEEEPGPTHRHDEDQTRMMRMMRMMRLGRFHSLTENKTGTELNRGTTEEEEKSYSEL